MKNILIVDENKDILDALSGSLCSSLKDCSILTASNCAKGESIMKTTPIDMILTELSMPVTNGYKFVEKVKKDYPFVPVCVMTGDCSPSVIERLRSIGVDRWIEKPFQFDQITKLISDELKFQHKFPQ
jgi:DNA-binding NtrC family response regulator